MGDTANVRIISGADVKKLLVPADVLAAVEETFRALGEGRIFHPVKEPMWLNDKKSNMLLAMPAFLMNAGIAGVKWVYSHRDQQPGYPSTGGILLLSHAENGQTYAIIEAGLITTMRTAGGHSVIAAKYLAKRNAKRLAIIGCGQQAMAGVASFAEVFPLEELYLFDKYPAAMDNLARLYGSRFKVVLCDTPRRAVEGADIVVTSSTAREPQVLAEWLPKGCFVAGVSSFFDLDPTLSKKADKWVLGSRKSDDQQIVSNPIFKDRGLSMDDVYADLGEIVTGKMPGRQSDDEIILFSHMGIGSLDIAVGQIVYERAVSQGLGTVLAL